MCTAVVGGSIQRAARRVRAAADQRSTTPMTIHRIRDRRGILRGGVLVSVFGVTVTSQNNSRGRVGRVGKRSAGRDGSTKSRLMSSSVVPTLRLRSGQAASNPANRGAAVLVTHGGTRSDARR